MQIFCRGHLLRDMFSYSNDAHNNDNNNNKKKIKNKKNNNNNNKETSLLTYDQFAFHYHRLKFYIKILKDLKH